MNFHSMVNVAFRETLVEEITIRHPLKLEHDLVNVIGFFVEREGKYYLQSVGWKTPERVFPDGIAELEIQFDPHLMRKQIEEDLKTPRSPLQGSDLSAIVAEDFIEHRTKIAEIAEEYRSRAPLPKTRTSPLNLLNKHVSVRGKIMLVDTESSGEFEPLELRKVFEMNSQDDAGAFIDRVEAGKKKYRPIIFVYNVQPAPDAHQTVALSLKIRAARIKQEKAKKESISNEKSE